MSSSDPRFTTPARQGGSARLRLVVPPLLRSGLVAGGRPGAVERDRRAAQLAAVVAADVATYELEWARRTVTRPVTNQFWVTVPVAGTPPQLREGAQVGICNVDGLWAGYPAPDGMRIASAVALAGDERGSRYLMLLLDVDREVAEHHLSNDVTLTARLRHSLERASAMQGAPA